MELIMKIPVYRVGRYEVARQTSDDAPEWVFFVVSCFPSKDLLQWGVDLTQVNRPVWKRIGYSLQVHLFRVFNLTADFVLTRLEYSLDDAFRKACHYAEKLAGLSEATRSCIDEHADEIRYRVEAQREVEEERLQA